MRQLGISSRYAKLSLETHDLINRHSLPALDAYSSVLLATTLHESAGAEIARALEEYVAGGGGLVVINPQTNRHLTDLYGIIGLLPIDLDSFEGKEPHTIHFDLELFPGGKDLKANLWSLSLCDHYELEEDASIVARTLDSPTIPVAWRRNHENGKVFVWNIDLSEERWGRVFLIQSILSVQAISVQFIANVGMIQIDDFPAGLMRRELEPVKSEFGVSNLDFLNNIWLPDMLELGKEFGFPYSFAAIFSYNDTTQAPYSFAEWEMEKLAVNGKLIPYTLHFVHKVINEGELGFHGYNHVPLRIEQWGSRQAMLDALGKAMERWKMDGLGHFPTSYVPPMNEYDRDGALAMTQAVPSLKVICGNFWRDRSTGGGREFEIEPWNPELFCLPRVTSGFKLTRALHLTTLSILTELGAWTHFLHPDDIFDIESIPGADYEPRNAQKLGWRGNENGSMRDQFSEWLTFVSRLFPWLRYFGATEAADEIQRHLTNKIAVVFHEDHVEIRSTEKAFIRVRVQNGLRLAVKNTSKVNVLQQHAGDIYNLWTISIPAGKSNLEYS